MIIYDFLFNDENIVLYIMMTIVNILNTLFIYEKNVHEKITNKYLISEEEILKIKFLSAMFISFLSPLGIYILN